MHPVRKYLPFIFVFVAFAGGFVFLSLAMRHSGTPPAHATVLPEPAPLPAFELTDQHGNRFTAANLAGDWHLVFFGFTHCPDVCPATLQQLAIANRRLAQEGAATPGIVLVSVDPERDSPAVLAEYAARFDAGMTALTGDLSELAALTRSLGIFFAKSPAADGDYSVDHSAAVLLLDPEGRWHSLFSAPHSVEHFVTDLPRLMSGR